MNVHSVFLRDNCVLPDSVDVTRDSFGKRWSHIEGLSSPDLDRIIRHAGWHYIWLTGGKTSRGWAQTSEAAFNNALTRALSGVGHNCNAAEIDSIKMSNFAGVWVANVTVQSRQIQQSSLMEAETRYGQALEPQ